MRRLEDTTAVVTGGASGLGRAISERLTAEGADVVITDVQAELGEATAAEGGFTFLEHDVCDEGRWSEVMRDVERRFGRVDVVVNNAGIGSIAIANPEKLSLEDWNRIFETNVAGVFLGCKAAIGAMRRSGGGSIVNISSVAAFVAASTLAYGATKAAVRHMTKSVAQYCAEQKLNIRCNSVHPGNVMTPLWEKLATKYAEVQGITPEQVIENSKQIIPLGDWTKQEDVAAAVAFLASSDARHITGARISVDGGMAGSRIPEDR